MNAIRRVSVGGLCAGLVCVAVLVPGCSESPAPVAPAPAVHAGHGSTAVQGVKDEKGFIDGWFDGNTVSLYYTKSYSCAEPPDSASPSNCVIGAEPEAPPRDGPIPTIFALAAVGFQPDPSTLACAPGSECLNHPLMIDASRIAGPNAANIPALPHSHLLDQRRGGWFKTVNVRVFNLDAWNAIVAAKSVAKMRELQGDPDVGTPGVISADTPTNIFFFIASFR